MAQSLDRTAFLSEPTRLRIAEICKDEALTFEEIAAMLERPSGSLSQPGTMLKHGALVEDKRRRKRVDGRSKARAFRLAKSWRSNLGEAQERRRPPWADREQSLLLIPLSETPAACAAIASGIADIEWGARVNGESVGLVVAPQSDADGSSTVRVVQALQGVARITRLQLNQVMSPSELREWSGRAVQGSSSAGELPPPS